MPKDELIDLSGKDIGELRVIEYNKQKKKWLCICSCGKEVFKRSWDIRHGKAVTCGDKKKHRSKKLIDITDEVLGTWHINMYLGDYMWDCTCSCGNHRIINGNTLRKSPPICGHQRAEDIKNRHFGDLVAVKYAGDSKWDCICKCGKTRTVATTDLKNGYVTACSVRLSYE